MSFTYCKDDIASSESGVLKIKIENYPWEEQKEDPPDIVVAAQGLEPQITSLVSSSEDNDSEDNYCVVKTEEETVQINEVTPYTCEICNATYDGLASYGVHLKDKHEMDFIHTEENTYNRRYIYSKKEDSRKKSYKCDECTSCFTQNSKLKRHKRIHTGEKPYKCDECTLSFITCEHLKKHKRIHAGEEPYKCDECTASFTASDSLKIHRRIHTGEKPYKCDECTLSFTKDVHLIIHKRFYHKGEKPHKCDECTVSFTGKQGRPHGGWNGCEAPGPPQTRKRITRG